MSRPSEGKEGLLERDADSIEPATLYSMTRKRERQVLDLLLQGCDNKEIATELGIKPRTVKAYFHRLFTRLKIRDGVKRVKLAVLIYREQLCSQRKNG